MDNQNQANQAPQAASYSAPSTTPTVTASTPAFPSINQLFKDSWQTLTQSILSLFLLNIIGIVIYLGLAVLAILILILSGAGSYLLKNGLQNIATNLPAAFSGPNFINLIITSSVIAVIFAVIFVIVSTVLQIASIIIVDQTGKASLGNTLRRGLGLVIPLFLTGILTFFLTFGAIFVLLLPALLFAFLLVFVQYEVILNNQRWTQAIKRSAAIVSKNFGAIFLRLLLLWLIGIGVFILFSIMENILPKDSSWLISILSFIFNLLFGWFSLAYTITLYKQARIGLEQEPGKGIAWMWIIAIIGWLIAIGLGFVTYKTISSGVLNEMFKNPASTTNISKTITTTDSPSKLQSAKSKINKSIEISNKQNSTKEENDQKVQLLAQAYSEVKDVTIQDPSNAQAWLYLGQLEKLLRREGEAKIAFEKALELIDKTDPTRDQIESELNSL